MIGPIFFLTQRSFFLHKNTSRNIMFKEVPNDLKAIFCNELMRKTIGFNFINFAHVTSFSTGTIDLVSGGTQIRQILT